MIDTYLLKLLSGEEILCQMDSEKNANLEKAFVVTNPLTVVLTVNEDKSTLAVPASSARPKVMITFVPFSILLLMDKKTMESGIAIPFTAMIYYTLAPQKLKEQYLQTLGKPAIITPVGPLPDLTRLQA